MARKKNQDTQLGNDNPQNETSKEVIESSEKAMDELVQITEELGLYDTVEAPTIALQEELEESDTEVANTDNVAVNASEELVDGVPDYEYHLFDKINNPIPAVKINIREMRINNLVDSVLFASYLGGELLTKGYSLGNAPYRCSMIIPADKLEQYNTKEGKLTYQEDVEYLEVNVKGVDVARFLQRLVGIGRKGAVIHPQSKVRTTGGLGIKLLTTSPVESSVYIGVGRDKPTYSIEQIKAMKPESLKIVCGWLKIPYRGSSQARIDIVKEQKNKG